MIAIRGDWPEGGVPNRPEIALELIDVRGVAALLQCSVRHVWRMADEGWMPEPVKLGALSRWRRADIAKWIESGCCPVCPKGGA